MSRGRPGGGRDAALARSLAEVWTDPQASPLRVRRLAARMSQEELARAAGRHVSTVRRAEQGDQVDGAVMFDLASALGCLREDIDTDYRGRLAPFDRRVC